MTPEKKALALDAENRCVVCEKAFSRLTRGLCSVHHKAYLDALSKLNDVDQKSLDSLLISQGKLLPDKRKKVEDFQKQLDDFVSERQSSYENTADNIEMRANDLQKRPMTKKLETKAKKSTKKKA